MVLGTFLLDPSCYSSCFCFSPYKPLSGYLLLTPNLTVLEDLIFPYICLGDQRGKGRETILFPPNVHVSEIKTEINLTINYPALATSITKVSRELTSLLLENRSWNKSLLREARSWGKTLLIVQGLERRVSAREFWKPDHVGHRPGSLTLDLESSSGHLCALASAVAAWT